MLTDSNELEIMRTWGVNPRFIEDLSASLLGRARELGFDDIVIRKRADGATQLVAIKKRAALQ